ncbi:MAG: tRNA pseudouridine(13) synthase TruD [Nitrososphaeria archaeon]|nr:tRNA pseudouridine(13) synthase TruD [Nitrososphaeria archaeon]
MFEKWFNSHVLCLCNVGCMLPTNIELEKRLGLLYYVTSTDGVGGRIRGDIEDFRVVEDSEISLDSRGEHLVLVIEKRDVTTDFVIRHISKILGLDRKFIGFAGIKDSRAVAVQKFSIPFKEDIDVRKFDIIGKVKVIEAYRTSKKIRLGMLKGNYFEITLRNCIPSMQLIESTLRELNVLGCPNYFGYQRFGTRRFNTHLLGKHLLKKEYEMFFEELIYKVYPDESAKAKECRTLAREGLLKEAYNMMPKKLWIEKKVLNMMLKNFPPQKIIRSLGRSLLKFYVNAYQSYLFNLMVSERIARGLPLNRLVEGDFVKGGSPALPILGFKSKLPEGEAGKIVKDVIECENLELGVFNNRGLGLKVKGSLRKVNLNYRNLEFSNVGADALKFFFWLEKGCYATILLREFCKNEFYK